MGGRWIATAAGLCALLMAVLLIQRIRTPGTVLASVPLGQFPGMVAVDDQTGRAFIANYLDTTVTVLDTATGSVVRTVTVGSNGGARPGVVLVDAPTGHVFVTTDDGQLSMLDARSGAVLGAQSLSGSAQMMDLDSKLHRLFVANPDTGTLSVVDTRTDGLMGTMSVDGFTTSLEVDEAADRLFITSNDSPVMSVLDARTGRKLHNLSAGLTPQAVLASPANGLLFVADARGKRLGIFNASGRTLLHIVSLGTGRTARGLVHLALDDTTGHLFAASGTTIRMLDERTGQLLHTASGSSRVVGLAVDASSHLCLALMQGATDRAGRLVSTGEVGVLDTRTGKLVRTVGVGVGPGYIGLDERHERALVIDTGLNPTGSFANIGAQHASGAPGLDWLRRLLPGLAAPAPRGDDGRGSVTVLDLSQL